ncbi:hypothetical protein BRD56_01405 [Thermoplasmatales archaeon SW_10_69_26]|nr:MAG: hypothetical protein BRD56_01405 [Thermoplasmatales archaeon SW_10_69_26]
MSRSTPFREAATVRVNAPEDRVRELLSDRDVLEAFDERLAGEDVEVHHEDERVEVTAPGQRLRLAFRLRGEGESTSVAALEDVEPKGFVERTKWMLFPGQAHEDLETELDRFRHIVEAFDTQHSA